MADTAPKRDRAAMMKELTEVATAMGYKGDEVRKFVDQELKAIADHERDEREARRAQLTEENEQRLAIVKAESEAEARKAAEQQRLAAGSEQQRAAAEQQRVAAEETRLARIKEVEEAKLARIREEEAIRRARDDNDKEREKEEADRLMRELSIKLEAEKTQLVATRGRSREGRVRAQR